MLLYLPYLQYHFPCLLLLLLLLVFSLLRDILLLDGNHLSTWESACDTSLLQLFISGSRKCFKLGKDNAHLLSHIAEETIVLLIDNRDDAYSACACGNFANPDMVGHTGVLEAAIKAIEAVDECVGRAVEAIKEVDGVMFVCADHGNAEMNINYETKEPWTAHTTNPVPFILYNYDPAYTLREGGKLCDIVPTLLEVMGMEQPAEMTGQSLLVRK